MEEMKPDTEVKEETSVPEEGAAEATAEKPAKKPHGFVQFIWFIVMSLVAFALQMIIASFGDNLLALFGVDNETFVNEAGKVVPVNPFIEVGIDSFTLAGFIAYLVANIVAKVISYILNRKKTFAAVNNLAFSFTVYVIMCVALIVAETFIAAPIQNFWISIGVSPDVAGMVTVITYSIPDFLIVFLMEKFVIMNNKLFAKKEEVAAADETAVAVDETAAVEAPVFADEAVAEEAPAAAAEEAPVEQAAEEAAVEEAQSEEAVEEVAEAVEEATPVEEVVTEEPLAETPQEEQAIAEAEAAEEQTPSDEAPAAIEEAPVEDAAPVEEVAAEEPVAEEAPVEETAPAEEPVAEAAPEAVAEEEVAAAAPVEEKPAKKAPAKKPAAKKAADKKPAAKKSDAKKPAAKKAAPKKEEPKKEEAKEAAPSNVTVLFEAPDTDSPKGKFVVIKDDLNPDRPYKFQLKANNGQVLYESESFKIKPRAKQIEVFRNTINNGTSTIDSEKNGTFRYKLFKADGSLYGVGEGYKTRASAESALESVKNFCNTSNVLEDTTVEDKK